MRSLWLEQEGKAQPASVRPLGPGGTGILGRGPQEEPLDYLGQGNGLRRGRQAEGQWGIEPRTWQKGQTGAFCLLLAGPGLGSQCWGLP